MMRVSIERQNQGRAFLDKPDAGVATAVNPSLMTLRLTEPPFQVQIVLREVHEGAHEQSGHETHHQFHKVQCERIFLLGESLLELFKRVAPFFQRTVGRVERVGNRLDLLHVLPHFCLRVFDEVQPPVDGSR